MRRNSLVLPLSSVVEYFSPLLLVLMSSHVCDLCDRNTALKKY